jgi:hypothetical protein
LLPSQRARIAGSSPWSAAHSSAIERRSTAQAAGASSGTASLIRSMAAAACHDARGARQPGRAPHTSGPVG